jgi:hypothetical protein
MTDKISIIVDDSKNSVYKYEAPIGKKHKFNTASYQVSVTIKPLSELESESSNEGEDLWNEFKTDYLTITNLDTDRITKQELAEAFTRAYGIQVTPDSTVSEGKRIGLRYEKGWRTTTRSSRSFNTTTDRGVFVGLRILRID